MITVTKVKALNQLAFDAADLDADIETKVQALVSRVSAQRKKVNFLLKKANTLAESPDGMKMLTDETAKLARYGALLESLLEFDDQKLSDKFTMRERFTSVETDLFAVRDFFLKHLSDDEAEDVAGNDDEDSIIETSLGYPEDRAEVKKGAK